MEGRRLNLHPATVPYQIILGRGLQVINSLVIFGFILFGIAGQNLEASALLLAYFIFGAIVFSIYIGWEILYYKLYSFGFSEDRFEIHSGVLFRREREIPVGRIQNVDINRNLAQRILGLSEVRLESAGGGETEAVLKYVDRQTGLDIKQEIKQRKENETEVGKEEEEKDDRPPAETIHTLSGEEFFLLCLCSVEPRMAIGVFLLFPSFVLPIITGKEISLILLLLFIIVGAAGLLGLWLTNAAKVFERYYGFQLSYDGSSLEYERGLLNRRTGHIPLDKVQRITVRENLLMRLFGFAALEVETAGYSPGRAEERGAEAAIPLGRKKRVLQLANRLMNVRDISVTLPPPRTRKLYTLRYGMVTLVLTGLFYLVSTFSFGDQPIDMIVNYIWVLPLVFLPGIPLMAHLRWKHLGYNLKKDHFVAREGFWNRATTIVPYFRTQTLIESQTIFQRFWQLSTFTLDTAGSFGIFGSDATAIHIDRTTADRLMTESYKQFQIAMEHQLQKHIKQKQAKKRNERNEYTPPALEGIADRDLKGNEHDTDSSGKESSPD